MVKTPLAAEKKLIPPTLCSLLVELDLIKSCQTVFVFSCLLEDADDRCWTAAGMITPGNYRLSHNEVQSWTSYFHYLWMFDGRKRRDQLHVSSLYFHLWMWWWCRQQKKRGFPHKEEQRRETEWGKVREPDMQKYKHKYKNSLVEIPRMKTWTDS